MFIEYLTAKLIQVLTFYIGHKISVLLITTALLLI
jgi:hypothetical protein